MLPVQRIFYLAFSNVLNYSIEKKELIATYFLL